jgi:hypothetical protein
MQRIHTATATAACSQFWGVANMEQQAKDELCMPDCSSSSNYQIKP